MFFTKGVELKGGRRNAPHQYPFRDQGFAEDLGRAMRVYVMSAFLVGDDLNLQYLALLNVLESDGPGPLIAPSTGLLSVLCAQFEAIQSTEGRVAEVRMTFIESGSLATPTAITDFVSAIVGAVAAGISSATTQFAADTTNTTVGLPQCLCRLSRASLSGKEGGETSSRHCAFRRFEDEPPRPIWGESDFIETAARWEPNQD